MRDGLDRVIGRCYVCQEPVRVYESARVFERADFGGHVRRVARLVHAGECYHTLSARIGGR